MKFHRISYAERAKHGTNPLAIKLFFLMDEKKTNLALSADVTTGKALLELAAKIGPEICLLKTHIDIIQDFTPEITHELTLLAEKHHFFIFEDRKFADIGNTVKQQYEGGIYRIADWANMINAHSLPGPQMIKSLAEIGLKKQRGLLLIAEMSSANNLFNEDYAQETVALAEEYTDFVIGFIAQRKLSPNPRWIHMTPGVQLSTNHDIIGHQYITPAKAILDKGSDVIIVGRGIVNSTDPLKEAKKYRAAGWGAYQNSLAATIS